MRIKERTILCVLLNTLGFGLLAGFALNNADLGVLFKIGPSDDLFVLSSKIDTWGKYIGLFIVICGFRIIEVLVNDVGIPALEFSIYNPTTNHIYGFDYWSLAISANVQWIINGLSRVLRTMVILSRFDVAAFSVITSELASGLVVHYLLRRKIFHPEYDTKEEFEYATGELSACSEQAQCPERSEWTLKPLESDDIRRDHQLV
jgi:hypothetical protein